MITAIKKDRLQARKDKNTVAVNILGLLISELDRKQNYENETVIKTIIALVNSNTDSIAAGGDVAKLQLEIDTLSAYLPKALEGDKLEVLVKSKCLELNITDMRGTGQVMGYLKKAYSDFLIDGAEVKRYVMEHVYA